MLFSNNEIPKIELDKVGYTKTLDKVMGEILRAAAREWLRTVLSAIRHAPYTEGDSFPIWSGMAKASLRPLGSRLRVAVPVSGSRPTYQALEHDKKRSKYRKRTRTVPDRRAEGEALGRRAFYIRDDKSHPRTFRYVFNFRVYVEHFAQLEDNHNSRVTSQTPWMATALANQIFNRYVQVTVRRRLPKVTNYLKLVRTRRGYR